MDANPVVENRHPAVFASQVIENRDRELRMLARPATWREWVGKGTNDFRLGDVVFDITTETNTFITTGTKKWRTPLYGRWVPRQEGVADEDQWVEVAFEEGARTKAFVAEYSTNPPTIDALRRFNKRILVKSYGPRPPAIRQLYTLYDGFRWENRPILYWGTKTEAYYDRFHGMDARTKVVWDWNKSDETPNLFALDDPTSYRVDGKRMSQFLSKVMGNFVEKSVGELRKFYTAFREETDRRLVAREPTLYNERVLEMVKERFEWRYVLINVRYTHERKLTTDTNRLIEEGYSIAYADPVSPLIDLATFNKKADSPPVAKMAGKWENMNLPDLYVRMRERAEAERDKRDELKQAVLAKVFHPERVMRVAEMYGLSMDEYLERV